MLPRSMSILLLAVAACSSDGATRADASTSDQGFWDVAGDVIGDAVGDAVGDAAGDAGADAPLTPTASDYCEQIVDDFCVFYLRCDRVVAADASTCQTMFLEMCNEVYEPRYVALEQAGLIQLSAAGISQCADHLAQVPCEQHLMDLAGPCRNMWQGRSPAGSACGLDIETFVCDAASTCNLDLSFCGSCVAAADTGGACSDQVRCKYPDECVGGTCLPPALPGDSCAESNCIQGAVCTSETCQARTYSGVGASCDSMNRCVPGSLCLGGTCVQSKLLGQACGPTAPCASGYCDGASGTCVQLIAPDQPCTDKLQCLSGSCQQGICGSLISDCL